MNLPYNWSGSFVQCFIEHLHVNYGNNLRSLGILPPLLLIYMLIMFIFSNFLGNILSQEQGHLLYWLSSELSMCFLTDQLCTNLLKINFLLSIPQGTLLFKSEPFMTEHWTFRDTVASPKWVHAEGKLEEWELNSNPTPYLWGISWLPKVSANISANLLINILYLCIIS